MKSVKTHFGVIISLLSLLMALQFGFFVQRLIASYEIVMKNEYSIVVVASKELSLEDVNSSIGEIIKLENINPRAVLDRLKDKISVENLEKLKSNLPKFYNVKIGFFPSNSELKQIGESLEAIEGVNKVEVFAKAHDSIYKVLLLMKNIIFIFTVLIVILGIMLMIRQMKIWLLEHSRRIDIMELFGASYILKSARLYQVAIFDTFVAFLLCVAFYAFLPDFAFFHNTLNTIGVNIAPITLKEIGILFIIGILLALICVTLVMVSIREKK